MSRLPTIADVVAHLRESGREAMALAVQLLEGDLTNCRQANEHNFSVVNELRAKYEQRPFRYAEHRAPAESDG